MPLLFRSWTARIVLAALTIEVGLICNVFTADISLLRRSEEGLFQTFLSWVREIDSKEVILETSPEANGWSLKTLGPGEAPEPWSLVEVPLERELFDGKVPQPSEYAVLLAKLHQAGARELAFTQSLAWKDAPELELRALDSSLMPFEEVLLPLDVSEVPEPEASPQWLEGSLISKKNLVGHASSLPVMNHITMSPSVSDHSGLAFAFPDFGGRDLQYRTAERLPLVTRWEGSLLPSWALSLVMKMEGVSLQELVIHPGRHIRVGTDGPVIPIDDYGRTAMNDFEVMEGELDLFSAKRLFPLGEVDLPELKTGVVLVDATNSDQAKKSHRLVREAQMLLQFPRPGRGEVFRRLNLGWEIFLYIQIVLVAFIALYLKPFGQFVTLVVLCTGLLVLVLGLLNWRGIWTPMLPLIAGMTLAWCLIAYLQQIAHPVVKRKVRG